MTTPEVFSPNEWRSAVVGGLRRNSISVPAATFDAPAWTGASVAVRQYNFSAAANFYIRKLPTKPDGATFMLCIRYRTGEEVKRYRLWDDDNFLAGNVTAPLYSDNLIKANFVIEVWSLQDEASIEQSAFTISTTLRTVTTDIRTTSDTTIDVSVTLDTDDLKSTTVLAKSPVAGFGIWLNPGDLATVTKDGSNFLSALDSVDFQLPTMVQATGANQPQWIASGGDGPNANAYVRFNNGVSVQNMVADENLLILSMFAVIRQSTWTSGRTLWLNGTPLTRQLGASPNLRIGTPTAIANIATADLGSWFILRVDMTQSASITAKLYDFTQLLETNTDAGSDNYAAAAFTIGHSSIGADFSFAELIGYPELLSDEDGDAVVAYLQQKYSGSQPATSGLEFNEDVAWLDND